MSTHTAPNNKKDFVKFILILGGVIAIGPLTTDVYLPAFNAISADLGSSERMLQLSLTTYFLGISFGQISYGPIIDRFGKKPPLLFGLILFFLCSVGCYYCTTIEQLIFFRFFQAIGACASAVVPRAIVRDLFSPQESARVFSYLTLVMGLAPILAPLIGNILLEIFGWRSIFAFLSLFSMFCLFLAWRSIPETKAADVNEKMSKAFRKYAGILRDRHFVSSALSGGFMMAGLFAYVTGSPAIYLDHFGFSSRQLGIIFSLNAIGFVVASQVNVQLLKRFPIEKLFKRLALIPLLIGLALLFCPPEFWPVTLMCFVFLFSCGLIFPNATASALANHAVHSGSASALLGTIQFGLAACSSFLVGKLSDGGIMSTMLVVGFCGIMVFVTQYFLKIRGQLGDEVHEAID